jgi:hypothetical protein
MRIARFTNAGLLALETATFIGLLSVAMASRTFSAATGPRSDAGRGQRTSGTPFRPVKQHSAEILSAQFQATVYEVQGTSERLGSLDAKALTSQAATPEALLSTLAQTGEARLLYRIEQPVNVFSTTITIGSSEPVITGTRTTTSGQAVNSISYQNVGVIVRLSAQGPPKDESGAAPIVTTAIRLSVLRAGEKEIAPGQKDSAIRAMSLDGNGALELNQPRVLLAISSNAFSSYRAQADRSGRTETPMTPVGYVIRYKFGPLAQGSGDRAARVSTVAPETARSTNTLTAQFQAKVYEVETTTNRLPTLDTEALTRAVTPDQLLPILNHIGKPKVLYCIDQPVNVFGDQVLIQANKPIVTATRSGRDGTPINSYTSHNMGVSVRFSAQPPPKNAKRECPDVTISFNVSADAPGNTDLGLGQMAPSFPMISQEHDEPLEMGRSRLMLAMGSPSAAEQAKPFVYVVCYQFGPAATN